MSFEGGGGGGSENMDEKFETKTDVRGTELKIYRDRII